MWRWVKIWRKVSGWQYPFYGLRRRCVHVVFLLAVILSSMPLTVAQIPVENNFFSAVKANQADSYITFSQGFGNLEPLIFEALVAPYFLLRTGARARYGATISTGIRLRMLSEESVPIRTPSYMPQVTFYRQIAAKHSGQHSAHYAFLMLAHHSNGQDGAFYLPDGQINVRDGNFSTNYLEIGVFLNRRIVPFSNTVEYFKTSLEWHPGIDMSDGLVDRYGRFRWHNSFKIHKFSLRRMKSLFDSSEDAYGEIPAVQTTIGTTWIFGKRNGAGFFDVKERFVFSLNLAYRPRLLKDVSLFARFYSGEDYYNLFFFRRITTLQFGIQAFAF